MQRLDDARALGPARSCSSSQGDDGDFTGSQRAQAAVAQLGGNGGRHGGVGEIVFGDVFDDGVSRQAVLCEAEASAFQILADLLVGRAVEAEFREQLAERLGRGVLRFGRWQN